MQENDDCQSTLIDKKHSIETRLDVPESIDLDAKKSMPEDSSADFEALNNQPTELYTKVEADKQKNEGPSLDQQASTTESIPEVNTEDDWLSYLDCDAIFDVTCENLSYYNSTKAEKDSDSDMDDTLTFDDAEDCETLVRDDNSSNNCCNNLCCQNVDDFDRSPDRSLVSPKISTIEIKIEPQTVSGKEDSKIVSAEGKNDQQDVNNDNGTIEENSNEKDQQDIDGNLLEQVNEETKSLDNVERDDNDNTTEKEEQRSDNFDFSSDSDEEHEKKLIYSSPSVNISAYFKFRDNLKDPKFEAALNRLDPKISRDRDESLVLEEVEETSTEIETSQKEEASIDPVPETGSKHVEPSSPEEYLEKLAEITESNCPKTEEQVQERLKRIAEGKAEIENRKNEALKDLSMEFNEVERLVAEQKAVETNDLSSNNEFPEESDNESEGSLKPGDIEMPLTKDQVAENFKFKTEEDEKRRTEKLQECLRVIPIEDMEPAEEAVEDETDSKAKREVVQGNKSEETIGSDISNNLEETSSTIEESKEADKTMITGIVEDIISETEDSLFWHFLKDREERTYIKGKVYEFDEKRHGVRMTEDYLKKQCKLQKLYQTPHLNDVLYLHYKGFSFIENLEKYTGLKCLWLQNNGIREIANVENQSELRCLYLQNNLIGKIENLDYQTKLDTLNLSHNTIRRIENLDSLKFLNTLNLSHNYLQDTADIEHLRLLDSLSVLDISHNRIDTEQVVNILGDMKELRVVRLVGNPVLKMIKLYRKTMILKCKNLRYLDDRPVFPKDRACAEAWMRGGPEEEAAERKRWNDAEQKKINDSVQALINKRKLYKPVGTSEKEAEDKKKTKEDEEEVAATSKLVCTSNELLQLERKKKSGVSSPCSSSASSSDDEEVENDGTVQKGIEKSDGIGPMAEEERKTPVDQTELVLPWKTQKSQSREPTVLVEDITEEKEYVAGDGERKRLAKEILDGRRSMDDPPGGYALERELAHYEKLVLETSNETAITSAEEKKSFQSTSVSCDILESKKTKNNEEDERFYQDIMDNYRRKDDAHPLSSQLSSIRQDMKGFCADMDKFVQDNKIVLENGDVKGFWGQKMRKEPHENNEQTDSATKEEKIEWWNTKERKLKVQEILKKREEETKKKPEEEQKVTKKIEILEADDKKITKEKEEIELSSSDSVYDLLNLKTCQKILLKDVQTYPENEDRIFDEPTQQEDPSSGIFSSLFKELNSKSRVNADLRKSKAGSHCELPVIEESEEVNEDAQRKKVPKKFVKREVDDASSNSTDNESDVDSIVTVIDLYDKSTKGPSSDQKQNSDTVTNTTEKSERKVSEQNTRRSKVESSNKSSLKSCKRTGDNDSDDVAIKRSHLIEEIDSEKEKIGYDVAERCRRHVMKEAKAFMKKKSPLIDQYIEDFITNRKPGDYSIPRNYEQMDFLDLSFVRSEPSKKSNETRKGVNLYQDFCEHLDRLNNDRKLLIEPDFAKSKKMDLEEKKGDVLSSRETKQSKKEQTQPLIEVIEKNPRNLKDVEQPEERPPVDPDDPTMDAALKDKILKSINAPKSEEQMERGKRSAEKLMKVSREAMAKRKSMLDQSSSSCIQQLEFDESRIYFKNLLSENFANIDRSEKIENVVESNSETEEQATVNSNDNQKESGKSRKSLELQVIQQN
ncbi:uncharacterized protein LOC100881639 isoform X2 [Megachile rotundata]|uniref:uncharacterized protein LOC100881639 isoform X2 n=1 Tax=Megachile rotundata TaxID=143995 RepID=UPI003FD020AA